MAHRFYLVTCPVFPDFGSEPAGFDKRDTWSEGTYSNVFRQAGVVGELKRRTVKHPKISGDKSY